MQKNLSPIGGRFNSYLNIYMQTTDAYAKTFLITRTFRKKNDILW